MVFELSDLYRSRAFMRGFEHRPIHPAVIRQIICTTGGAGAEGVDQVAELDEPARRGLLNEGFFAGPQRRVGGEDPQFVVDEFVRDRRPAFHLELFAVDLDDVAADHPRRPVGMSTNSTLR